MFSGLSVRFPTKAEGTSSKLSLRGDKVFLSNPELIEELGAAGYTIVKTDGAVLNLQDDPAFITLQERIHRAALVADVTGHIDLE